MSAGSSPILSIAQDYIARNFAVVPINHKQKAPKIKAWEKLNITADNAGLYFNGADQNIGVQLGARSNGLSDVDLDCAEAVRLAPYFLPPTEAVFGRASKPSSHYLYFIDDAPEKATEQLKDENKQTIIELRMGGGTAAAQTVFPGSTHPSGETIQWVNNGAPAKSDYETLKRAITKIAIGALLMRQWPKGSGHEAAQVIGGVLARCGWRVEEIGHFVGILTRLAGELPTEDDNNRTAKNSAEAHANGQHSFGFPKLIEDWGEKSAKAIAKILGYKGEKSARAAAAGSGEATIDPDVARVNETHALVIVGDKTVVLKLAANDISFLTVSAFDQWHANQYVIREKKIPLAKYWMSHPQRKQYEGIVFDPSCLETPRHFNLWRGFAVEPRPGDCSKFLAHLCDNVCRGDEALYNWVVGWLADIVQHPAKKIGTSLALRGPQGVGKTKVGEVFGSLMGPHYALVSDPRFITGRFNGHLVSCILLHCDEAFWAGDHAAEGKLKDLVTGDQHFVEFKGKEAVRVRNHVRLLVSGNQNWLVPAGFGERRFATLDVGEDHKEDHAYFAAIDAEMDNGGREALLHYLLNFDLTTVNLRTIPKTMALLDQKLSSLDAEQGWWLDVLSRGELPWGCELNSNFCPSDRLFDRYIRHAGRHGARRKSIQTQLGIFLTKHVPGLRRNTRGRYSIWVRTGGIKETTGTTYEFPSLQQCRMAFASALQQDFTWDEKEAWTHEPPPDTDIDDTGI
jgi:hypothetical protein